MLNDFLHGLRYEDVPDDVIAFAKRCLLDLIGVGAAGATTTLSQIIRKHALMHFAPGLRNGGFGDAKTSNLKASPNDIFFPDQRKILAARLLFDGRLVSPVGAALANGATIDAMDGHDGHKLTKGHVGCGVLPSDLAVLEAEGKLHFEELLTSLVIGYELGTRFGMALHKTAPDYHTSGAWIALACAGLGARALGLGAAASREALGIAEYHGPRSQMMRCIDHPTMVKDGSGWGAMAGVSAAYLAADGFTGAPARTHESTSVSELWSDLGSKWRIFEQYFKPAPVCRWAQPPMQAILDIKEQHALSSQQVERIEIVTFHESLRLATRFPKTTEEAQYSTVYAAAAAMVYGKLGPKEVRAQAFRHPEILRLSQTMHMQEQETYNAAFPAQRIAHVTLALKDGRQITSPPTEARGDPENPLEYQEILEKFHRFADPVLGLPRAQTIARCIEGIEPLEGESFFNLLFSPPGESKVDEGEKALEIESNI